MIKEEVFLGELRAHIARDYITNKAAAASWLVSHSYVCAVTRGERPVPPWMAEKVGYKPVKRITYTFEEIEE